MSASLIKKSTAYLLVFGNLKYKAENNKWFYPAIKAGFRYSINPSNVLALRMVYSYYDDEASNIQFDYNKNIIKNVAATFTAKLQRQDNKDYTDIAASMKYYF